MKTFFFYDLETSGFSPREDRIMQFAGQRTDMNFNRIGESVNILIRLNDDVLPSVNALMVTNITPQKTVEEGYTEAEFAKMAIEDFFTPDTIAVGYNNIRFDDEHMRHLFWRNFHEPYEWQFRDGRSKWDFLDVVRMVRALRPDGINWPFLENDNGEKFPTNKLELLTKMNGISHENAHDAMSDVDGLIDVVKLIKEKQPRIFDFLFKMREKSEVQKLVNLENPQLFVYTSGRYSAEFEKTTVAFPVAPLSGQKIAVWDCRFSPEPFLNLSSEEIFENLTADFETRSKDDFVRIPAKSLQYNRCPAVAPIGVLNEENQKQLKINLDECEKHAEILAKNPHFLENLRTAFENRQKFFFNKDENEAKKQPEARLYESFLPAIDKPKIAAVRNATTRELADFHPDFSDERLSELLLHYKARSFPKSLSAEEKQKWEEYRIENLQARLSQFIAELQENRQKELSKKQIFTLDELELWLNNILPDIE